MLYTVLSCITDVTSRALSVNSTPFHSRVCFLPSLAQGCLYPQPVSVGARGLDRELCGVCVRVLHVHVFDSTIRYLAGIHKINATAASINGLLYEIAVHAYLVL